MRGAVRSLMGSAVVAAVVAALLSPAAAAAVAQPPHHPSMLYAVSGSQFTLTSADGRTGLLTVSDPDEVLQFTDRPDHWSDRIPASAMLSVLGLTGRPLDVKGEAPNAVLALTGRRTLPLEITHGSVGKDGTLRLRVARLGPALPSASGTGSLFVDSVAPVHVTLVGSDGVQWGALDVYWEGSHWSVIPYFDGTEMAKSKFYLDTFLNPADHTDRSWGESFWWDDDRFTVGFMIVDGDLSRLRITNYMDSHLVIDANAPGGPSCDGDCVIRTSWSGPLYATG